MWTKRAIRAGLSVDFPEALKASEIIYLGGCMATEGREGRHRCLHGKEKAGLEGQVDPRQCCYTPKEEIRGRIDKLKALMEKASLDGAFFHYKIDYYYLSGTMQDAFLFVPIDGDPILFVRREFRGHEGNRPLKRLFP